MAATDTYSRLTDSLTSPAVHAFDIVPDTNADLPIVTRGIYVGVGGNLSVIMEQDTAAVTFVSAQTGTILPIRVKRVRAAPFTTAANLIGLY